MAKQEGRNADSIMNHVLLMIILLLAASAIGFLFRFIGFPETNIVIIYILFVLMTAWLTEGFLFGILSSVLATFLFNYFFTEPYFTFSVNDPSYIITFIIMTMTALITCTITSHAKQSALEAEQREAETRSVYNLTNRLTDAKDIHDIAGIAAGAISECFDCRAGCLCFDEGGTPEKFFIQQVSQEKQIRRDTVNVEKLKGRIENLQAGFYMDTEFYDLPVRSGENTLGLIRIPKENALKMNEGQTHLLRSMIESTALAMDRFRSAEQRIKSREEAVQERYRGNLLRAISHDLRTPLSGIMGTSEMLMDMTDPDDPRYSFAFGIHKDADWLHSMVENILSLTRLQEGRLIINRQMEAVEEVIAGAADQIAKRSKLHEINVSVPDELLLVPMDAKLIKQVLINLMDNAVKHTPPDQEISISVEKDVKNRTAVFRIKDRGSGIAEADLPNLFQMFYTSRAGYPDAKQGIGLGLTICDAIIRAHGGSIEAHNRTDGSGAEFLFTLPLEVEEDEQL